MKNKFICKLTKRQRLIVYKELLKKVCEDPSTDYGMCWYLDNLLDEDERMPAEWRAQSGFMKLQMLNELCNAAKKYNVLRFWTSRDAKGWKKRIGWIEQAIVEVKK